MAQRSRCRRSNPFTTINPHAGGVDIWATHHVVAVARDGTFPPEVVTCTRSLGADLTCTSLLNARPSVGLCLTVTFMERGGVPVTSSHVESAPTSRVTLCRRIPARCRFALDFTIREAEHLLLRLPTIKRGG
jgi:hypothetical protein